MAETARDIPARAGIQSVEVAGVILKAMAEAHGPLTLKDLASRAGMHAAKVHRYLVSLTRIGLLEQDPSTGRYLIGPLSLSLGLAALGAINVVRIASAAMPGLRDTIDETIVLTVWGSYGPTIVRFEESSHPVTVNVRVGNVLPLLTTALGRIYGAFVATKQVTDTIEAEMGAGAGPGLAREEVSEIFNEVRKRRSARIAGDLLPGVSAMAAPIFDHQGHLAAAIGAIGRQADFDTDWDGPIARALRQTAAEVSGRLGHSATD